MNGEERVAWQMAVGGGAGNGSSAIAAHERHGEADRHDSG